MSKKVYLCNWICVRCIRCNMRRFGGLRLRPWIGVRVDLGFLFPEIFQKLSAWHMRRGDNAGERVVEK